MHKIGSQPNWKPFAATHRILSFFVIGMIESSWWGLVLGKHMLNLSYLLIIITYKFSLQDHSSKWKLLADTAFPTWHIPASSLAHNHSKFCIQGKSLSAPTSNNTNGKEYVTLILHTRKMVCCYLLRVISKYTVLIRNRRACWIRTRLQFYGSNDFVSNWVKWELWRATWSSSKSS